MKYVINCSSFCLKERALHSVPPFSQYQYFSFKRCGVEKRTNVLACVLVKLRFVVVIMLHQREAKHENGFLRSGRNPHKIPGKRLVCHEGRLGVTKRLKLKKGELKIATRCATCADAMMLCIKQELSHSTGTKDDVDKVGKVLFCMLRLLHVMGQGWK